MLLIERGWTEIRSLWPQMRRWALRGGWAVVDQGLSSGVNFLVNILLARWLPPKEYGAFAVALSVFYLLAAFHTAVLTEPMMVFGAGKCREHFRKYLGMLLYGHWGLTLLSAFVLSGVAFVMKSLGLPTMAQGMAWKKGQKGVHTFTTTCGRWESTSWQNACTAKWVSTWSIM